MKRLKIIFLLVFIIVTVLVPEQECGRGGFRSRGRPSSSSPSRSYPSPSHTSHSTSHNYGWNHSPSSGYNPSTHHGTHGTQLGTQTNRGTATSRPIGFDLNNNHKVQNNYQTGSQPSAPKGPDRPLGFDNKPSAPPIGSDTHNKATGHQVGSQQPSAPPIGFNTNNKPTSHQQPSAPPIGFNTNNKPTSYQQPSAPPIGFDNHNKATGHQVGSYQPSAPTGFNPHHTQTSHNVNSQPTSNIGWNIPPRPGSTSYHPQGPPQANSGYHQYQQYPQHSSYTGPTKVKIVNKYNYHYPGYYSVPQQNSFYPGYYHSTPSYHYSSFDTGSTALGFALGYSLAKITTPTYSHQSFYDGYRPRYDHYEVHHYYHNRDAVPQNQEIKTNTIVGCVGDAPTVCPVNTTSLCTSNGALMCVVSATSTVPCLDNKQVNCVRSQVSCVNNTAPECKNAQSNTASINIPCISTAKIQGELKVLNNTIVPEKIENATMNANNTISTTTANPVNNNTVSTQYPITTTPTTVSSTIAARKRRDANPVQEYCVTIVALPAAKKETEGEKLFKDAQDVALKFLEKAWGL